MPKYEIKPGIVIEAIKDSSLLQKMLLHQNSEILLRKAEAILLYISKHSGSTEKEVCAIEERHKEEKNKTLKKYLYNLLRKVSKDGEGKLV